MNCTTPRQEPQLLSREKLRKLLQQHSVIKKIHAGVYRPIIESNRPARQAGGRDLIVSYYDGDQYVCTKHRVIVGIMDDIQETHQDVEAAVVNGIRYERTD